MAGNLIIGAYLPIIYTDESLFDLEPLLVDKYDKFYSHLGLDRFEMPQLISAVTRVDILAGTRRNLEYI